MEGSEDEQEGGNACHNITIAIIVMIIEDINMNNNMTYHESYGEACVPGHGTVHSVLC